jgi:hypothetical protein
MNRLAPPIDNSMVRSIVNEESGEEVTKLDELREGETYVVCGELAYMPTFVFFRVFFKNKFVD